jgi:hypothetical protein
VPKYEVRLTLTLSFAQDGYRSARASVAPLHGSSRRRAAMLMRE